MTDATEDKLQKLFEDAGLTDEVMEQLAAHFRCAVDEQVMQELASSLTFMKETLQEELVSQLDEYLHEMFSELEQRLDEDNDRVAEMIYLAADSKSSAEFIARAAASAREIASDRGNYRNVDEVPDSESEKNRQSLRPHGGRSYGTQGIRESVEDETTSSAQEVDPRIARYVEDAERRAGILPAEENKVVQLYCEHAERELTNPLLALSRGSGWQGKRV